MSGRLAAAGASAQYAIKGKLGLGWSQFQAGKLAEAAATFDEVLKKNPPEAIAAEAALARGQILEKLGQNEPALAMYDLVIGRYPKSQQHADALLAAARLHDKLKQPGAGGAALRATGEGASPVLQTRRRRSTTGRGRCGNWARRKTPTASSSACARSIRKADSGPTPRIAWPSGPTMQRTTGRAGGLIDEVLAAKADPQVREYAMHLRGEIAVAKADWPKVREVFEALAKEFPESRRRLVAEYWIAEAYYRQADYKAAGARLQRLAEQIKDKREPWMAMIPLRRAQMLVEQEQWNDA